MVAAYVTPANKGRVVNNAGGDTTFQVADLDRLERFLVLGTVGGTYYVNEKDHTKQNLGEVERIIADLGNVAVDKIVEIGKSGRAPKHDPALVAYAIAVSTPNPAVRAYALGFFNEIVRTGTHLFHFMAYVKGRRGEGRAFKRALENWYTQRSPESLANQLVKYRQRDGWSHRDVLRIAHPKATSQTQNALFKYAVSGTLLADDSRAHEFVMAADEAARTDNVDRAIDLITAYGLPREVVNTKINSDPRIWEALAPTLGLTALLRNLRNMHKNGYLVQGSDAVRLVRERIIDQEALSKARIHPAHLFLAKFNATEIPQPIQNALEDAFYLSFANVEPTNKRMMLALDVSGSMTMAAYQPNAHTNSVVPTAAQWSALVAMVTARTEPYAEFRGFSTNFIKLDIRPTWSMDEVYKYIFNRSMGGTDCSLPMFAARKDNEQFDAFVVYTDNETWAGGGYGYGRKSGSSGDPMGELRAYRKASGIEDAKLIVSAITSTGFTIADPKDPNTLDVVGMDANTPAIISNFIR